MRHQTRGLRVDMPAPIPTGLPTLATPHVSCCKACSSTKIAAALVPDAAASSALTVQQHLMQFFGIEPISLPYACPLGGESPHKLQVCGGPALLETRCPYEFIDDPRLQEILQLLQQWVQYLRLPVISRAIWALGGEFLFYKSDSDSFSCVLSYITTTSTMGMQLYEKNNDSNSNNIIWLK